MKSTVFVLGFVLLSSFTAAFQPGHSCGHLRISPLSLQCSLAKKSPSKIATGSLRMGEDESTPPQLDPRFESWVERSHKMSEDLEVLFDQSGAQVDPKSVGDASVGLLFSSGWCPACVSFAPLLKAFVDAQNDGTNTKVQLVFVSSDPSAADAQAVFKQSQGDWLMLDYDSPLQDEWKRRYGVWAGRETAKFADSIASFKARRSGIPAIAVVDKAGDLVGFLDVEARGVESLLKWQPEEFVWE